MSYLGKVNRGLKWYARNRDLEGNLLPCITEDPTKMGDVQAYLDHKKKLEEEEKPKEQTKSNNLKVIKVKK